jgi:hypothetical protein
MYGKTGTVRSTGEVYLTRWLAVCLAHHYLRVLQLPGYRRPFEGHFHLEDALRF